MSGETDDLLLTVGAELDAARKRAQLSQAALAELAELAPSTVSHALRCGDIRLSTLAALAAATGCTVAITIRPHEHSVYPHNP